ncbi:hypothetical protein BDY21DRAFT_416482 [Lineolata rhizophorae]|uniref:Glucose-methanol-choline oxidoreductase N-terminal domain-containing protein n=1 Tax=Lineolata rhizophorae TaxID=578093 RepID=A0A6A6NTR6_9PEZI|nr:hypothetical protein BDY21DRAFT_416482 [Lineolata rhizophorae]
MTYDFIVVGAGPAGTKVATRLANSRAAPKVLLIEGGGNMSEPKDRLLFDRWTTFMEYPRLKYDYYSEPQKSLGDRVLPCTSGKGLGGSSAINFSAWTIGPKADYDLWAKLVDDESFNWEHAQRRLKAIERYDFDLDTEYQGYSIPDRNVRGTDGRVNIELPTIWESTVIPQLDGFVAAGWRLNGDLNNGFPLGIGALPSTSRKAIRETAASALLEHVPSNLEVLTDSQVERIIFDGARAVGVESNGKQYKASKEVIISSGSVNTPKLLLLSGVGPAQDLTKLGIALVSDVHGVGSNLQDHYLCCLTYELKPEASDWTQLPKGEAEMAAARDAVVKKRSGPLASLTNLLVMGYSQDEETLKSAEFAALPPAVQEYIRDPTVPTREIITHNPSLVPGVDPDKYYLCVVTLGMVPQSRGRVFITSTDPFVAPHIDLGYCQHPFDRRNMVESLRATMHDMEHPKLSQFVQKPWRIPKSDSDEDIWDFAKGDIASGYHLSCTCKMGQETDDMAVVDTKFRVKGTQGLRVADMSVMPFTPNAHTMAWAYMIGEVAAEKLIEDYELDK